MSSYLESKRQLIVNASFTEKPGKKYPKNDVCTREGDKKNPTHLAVYEYDCEFLLLLHKIRYIFALVNPLECSIHEP